MPSPLVLVVSLHVIVFVQMESCFTYVVICLFLWASLVAQTVKNLPEAGETWIQSLCREDPLEEGVAARSSVLAWRIPFPSAPVYRR